MAAIEIHDLRIDYGDFTAVKNLSLSVTEGEIYGLVGPNGAGKTSTLNVLATLLAPTHGSVRLMGFDCEMQTSMARSKIGYMPDLAPVIKDLKVWEFLDLFAGCHGLQGPRKTERVNQCLEQVNLADKRDVLCGTLSRGMTQRVVLAKTILHKPAILLLDEPASGLDPIARIQLKDTLQELAKQGTTIVLSSHILSELAEMVTSIGILHHGELRRHGAVSDVLDSLAARSVQLRVDLVREVTACQGWLTNAGYQVTTDPTRPRSLSVAFDGTEADQAEFLQRLITAGFAISGFHAKSSSLEDVMREISLMPK